MKTPNVLKVFTSLVLMALVSLTLFSLVGLPFLYSFGGLFVLGFIKGLLPAIPFQAGMIYDGFVITDQTYAGEAASQFIVKAITGADTIAGGHVYIKDGIKKKFTIPRWDANYEDFIQDRAAMPVTKGTMTIDGQVIDPEDYMIFNVFNPRDFESQWMATQLSPEIIDRKLPYSVESVVVQEVLKRHAKYLNKALWNNSKSSPMKPIYKYWDGFIQNALQSTGTILVPSPTTITAANIQAVLLSCYEELPEELRYNESMKFFCSYNTFDLYDQSQVAQQYKGIDITQSGKDTFKGRKVVKIADFPDNTILATIGTSTPESNMWVGMNSVDDEGLTLGKYRPEGELWFIKMNMKVDVNFGWPSEVVLYGTGSGVPEE